MYVRWHWQWHHWCRNYDAAVTAADDDYDDDDVRMIADESSPHLMAVESFDGFYWWGWRLLASVVSALQPTSVAMMMDPLNRLFWGQINLGVVFLDKLVDKFFILTLSWAQISKKAQQDLLRLGFFWKGLSRFQLGFNIFQLIDRHCKGVTQYTVWWLLD